MLSYRRRPAPTRDQQIVLQLSSLNITTNNRLKTNAGDTT